MSRLRWRPTLPIVAVLAVALAFFWKLAFTHLILARGDLLLYFYPYWEARAAALRAGRLPLWNPYLFMGVPFLANSQAGVLYPLNWPLAWLGAPEAVKVSILMHIGLAATGVFALARRALGQGRLAAAVAAITFTLGGYFSAQVEHINQFQGLAWLPWLLLAAHHLAATPGRCRDRLRAGLVAAGIVALQLLAGHTQTAVISLAGAALYAVVAGYFSTPPSRVYPAPPAPLLARLRGRLPRLRAPALALLVIVFAAALAALLASAQLLPTFELSGQSLRGGGLSLREAVSFSLPVRLLGRALLPGYTRSLFSEFVAYSGLAGLVLAGLGVVAGTTGNRPVRFGLLALAVLGLGFALGSSNPLYLALALVPPLNLFRAPARWLIWLALAVALLAGYGIDALGTPLRRRQLAGILVVPVVLLALALLSAGLVPAGETGPLPPPGWADWLGWLLVLALAAAVLLAPDWRPTGRRGALALLAVAELFAASRGLPYNQPTAPEAWRSVRPALSELLVAADAARAADPTPPGRFLSLSTLQFDPGDLAELRHAYDSALPTTAQDEFIVATKHKEVLSPNLPLAWQVPAVDGYDGGVLPLRSYAALAEVLAGAPSTDGRLRENLPAVPDARLLALVNAQFLITDKLADAWTGGVFFDLAVDLKLAAGETEEVAHMPVLQATALGVVAEADSGAAQITFDDGRRLTLPLRRGLVPFGAPGRISTLSLLGPIELHGLSLVDERTGAHEALALGPFRRVHSGDVKVYENLAVLPRAWVAPQALVSPNEAAAQALLASPELDPAKTVVLVAGPEGGKAPDFDPAGPPAPSPVSFLEYEPERVALRAAGPGYLVLADVDYPGWKVTVDGHPASLLRANLAFRAVLLAPGDHDVVFVFEPGSVRWGFALSALGLVGLLGLALALRKKGAPA